MLEENLTNIQQENKQLKEITNRLNKEISYTKWKIQQYEDNPGYAELEQRWSDTLAVLQMIDGTHSHDADYDLEFEKTLGDNS